MKNVAVGDNTSKEHTNEESEVDNELRTKKKHDKYPADHEGDKNRGISN